MKQFSLVLIGFLFIFPSCGQQKAAERKNNTATTELQVGGRCEDCEAIYESPISFDQLDAIDTLPDFAENGPRLEISGVIYKQDGKTPAAGIILYFYHTDQKGVYPHKGNETGAAKKHGYLRGWIKTDADGRYRFYTLRPASYPNSTNPAHIHAIIKEEGKKEYWIEDYLFADDPFLPKKRATGYKPRGGDGVLKPEDKNGLYRATRNIILGQNVDDYPSASAKKIESGLAIGANCPAFDPLHISGADKNKTVCPMCKYGYGQGIMVWFNHANLDQLAAFAQRLEAEIKQRGEIKLRVFLVYMNDMEGMNTLQQKLQNWCKEQKLEKVALVCVPSPVDEETAGLFAINPEAKNTVFVYKKRTVAAKWVNIDYTEENTNAILTAL